MGRDLKRKREGEIEMEGEVERERGMQIVRWRER